MPIVPPVVWSEGMALDPHHFQHADRHHRSVLDGRLRALHRHAWGATRVEIDAERLANGEFHVTACAGVLPDGFAFDLTRGESLPAPRAFAAAFPLADERLGVYLALPLEREGSAAVTLPDAPLARVGRFRAASLTLADQNTGGEERSIDVALPYFQLLFGTEARSEFSCLPLAELVRTAAGGYRLDENFAPPALSLAASEALVRVARGLTEVLYACGTELGRRRAHAAARHEVLPADLAVLLLLRTVHGFAPVLHHHAVTGGSPEALYLTLVRMAGELAALDPAGEAHPRAFPAYNHEAPGPCFRALDALVRALIDAAMPVAGYVTVALARDARGVFAGRVAADRLLEEADLYLVGAGDLTGAEASAELPQKLRVASPDRIDDVLRSYTRALAVTYVVRPPVQLPSREGLHYYRLEKQGPFWDAILRAREVAVFVPAELPALDFQLIALRPS